MFRVLTGKVAKFYVQYCTLGADVQSPNWKSGKVLCSRCKYVDGGVGSSTRRGGGKYWSMGHLAPVKGYGPKGNGL